MLQCANKTRRTFGDPLFKQSHYPSMNPALEGDAIGLNVPFQIVATDIKRISRRHTEQPVQRLRLHFNIFKLALRLGIASVRAIPVAEINQLTARFIRALQHYYQTPPLTAKHFPWPEDLH